MKTRSQQNAVSNRSSRILRLPWLLIILAFVFGAGSVWSVRTFFGQKSESDPVALREIGTEGYHFIHPLLAMQDKKEFLENKEFESKLLAVIQDFHSQDSTTSASVYFRDPELGRWFGIDEYEKFSPASLYKVIVMIAYLKQAESDPQVLSQQIEFSSPSLLGDSPDTPPAERIKANTPYTVNSLFPLMIIYSDNNALNLLDGNLNPNSLKEVYTDLGFPVPDVKDRGDTMTAKAYALILRVLYNATYLNRPHSEEVLNLLSKSTFTDGLVAGVSPGTVVAHKFGYRLLGNSAPGTPSQELHDCGIIYYPGHPYILCVMTKGNDHKNLRKLIRNISRATYEEVSRQYPQ